MKSNLDTNVSAYLTVLNAQIVQIASKVIVKQALLSLELNPIPKILMIGCQADNAKCNYL